MRTVFNLTCDPPAGRVEVCGGLDPDCRRRLRDVLHALRLRGCVLVEVDLSQVSSVDAGTFCLLDQEREHLEGAGGALLVSAASDSFRRAALLAGYADLLPAAPEPNGAPSLVVVPKRPQRSRPMDDEPA